MENFHINKHQNQMEYLTFTSLEQFPSISHLFSTRNGGISTGCYHSLNFAFQSGDLLSNIHYHYRQLAEVLGTSEENLVTSAQTHTSNIRIVSSSDCGKGLTKQKDFSNIDGLLTNQPNIGIITAHADCNAIFFFDPVNKVIGLAHSGWSGTLKNIAGNMIQQMTQEFYCNPDHIIIGIGPSLCQKCFEVDFDVSEQFIRANSLYQPFIEYTSKKAYIDLRKIILFQLGLQKIPLDNISQMDLCTKCRPDLFYSHRNQGTQRGVMVAAMILHPEKPA